MRRPSPVFRRLPRRIGNPAAPRHNPQQGKHRLDALKTPSTVAAWLLACACLFAGGARASAPPASRALDLLDLAAPAFTTFSTRDGLPDAVIVAMATDRDGYTWSGSPRGLSRYEGSRWVAPADPRLAHPVDSLLQDDAGTLWVGFRNRGIARYDGSTWRFDDLSTGLPTLQIRRIARTRDAQGGETLWALTVDQGLLRLEDGRWRADPGNPGLPRTLLTSIATTHRLGGRPRTWLATGQQGVWYRDAGETAWRRYAADGFNGGQMEFLHVSTRDEGTESLWMSGFGSGLWRLDDGGLRHWSSVDGSLPGDELYDIVETGSSDADRTVWVATRTGVLRVRGDQVRSFDRGHGLPSDVIRGLHAWRSPDGDDVVWLATESGVARTTVGENPWLIASLLGARSIGVFAVLVEEDGDGGERLWVGAAQDGIAVFDHGQWRRYTHEAGHLPGRGVSMIVPVVDGDGRRTRWVGTWSGELVRVHDEAGGPRFETVPTPWTKAAGGALLDTLVRRVGGVDEQWVASRLIGLWRLREGQWRDMRPAGLTGPWRVNRLLEHVDRAGRRWLWASTDHGLARIDDAGITLFGREAGLPDTMLLGMHLVEGDDGRPVLWLGSASAGVVRVDIGDPRRPKVLQATLPTPPDATVYSAMRDRRGRVYVCTNNGVQLLEPDGDGWRSRVYGRADGMVHEECNTNAQAIDAQDRYWAGTLGGLAVHDPNRRRTPGQPKPLRLTSLRVAGEPVAGDRLHLPAGASDAEVGFAQLTWLREGDTRYRTQLLGLEDAPGPWGAQSTRALGTLPPGDYRLRIEAVDYAGVASEPLELPVLVDAHWWQTWWARVAGIAGLLLLGYGVSLLRARRMAGQQRLLERHVALRTAELNTANARLAELSYRDALTGLANRRRLLEALEACPGNGTTSLVFVDVDDFKAYNDRFGHPAGDEALRTLATAMRECAPADALVARYGGEEFACLLPRTDCRGAAAFAERLRNAIAGRDIAVPGTADIRRITISAGVACIALATADDVHHLMREADIALYRAKRLGRDRVEIAGPQVP